MTRAQFLRLLAAGVGLGIAGPSACAEPPSSPVAAKPAGNVARMHTRPIPATGEALPVVGCGTWKGFDVRGGASEIVQLGGVIAALHAAGGSVIDSSPMYGRSEAIVGRLLADPAHRAKPSFLATKVWTHGRDAGIAQMRQSMRLLGAERLDLMQVHNLLDTATHWPVLRRWKDEGRVRYLGLTHYTASAYADLEHAIKTLGPDFVQLNYSIDDRAAERRLLPLAQAQGVAVLVNLPFGGGGLLGRLRNVALPEFAAEVRCDSWAQLLLKFVLSHPAVTAAIPATADAAHLRDNLNAATGRFPDEKLRARIAALNP